MKKLFISIAVCAMMFTACKKYDVSNEITQESIDAKIASLPTVVVSGTIYADLDKTTPGLEKAPGVKIRVAVPYSAYGFTTSNGYWIHDAVTNDGVYSIPIPAPKEGVTASFEFDDFFYDVKKVDVNGNDATEPTVFTIAAPFAPIDGLGSTKNGNIKHDVTYIPASILPTDTAFGRNIKREDWKTLEGKLEYVSVDSSAVGGRNDTEPVEEATIVVKITLTSADGKVYEKTTFTKTDGSGRYKIDVPMVPRGSAVVELEGEIFKETKFIKPAGQDNETWECKHELQSISHTVYSMDVKGKKDTYTIVAQINQTN